MKTPMDKLFENFNGNPEDYKVDPWDGYTDDILDDDIEEDMWDGMIYKDWDIYTPNDEEE